MLTGLFDCIAEGARTKDTGRTGSGMASGWRAAGAGFTEANGLKASRAATVSVNRLHRRPSMTERGLTDSRTDTDPKLTLMEVPVDYWCNHWFSSTLISIRMTAIFVWNDLTKNIDVELCSNIADWYRLLAGTFWWLLGGSGRILPEAPPPGGLSRQSPRRRQRLSAAVNNKK